MMSKTSFSLGDRTLDRLLSNLESLKHQEEISDAIISYFEGDYKAVLANLTSQALFGILSQAVLLPREQQDTFFEDSQFEGDLGTVLVLLTGLAAFNTFLQANVTGPPLELGNIFLEKGEDASFTDQCLKSLDVDGVSVYQYIPCVDLFCLARMVFTIYFPRITGGDFRDSKWMRIRINAYHQRLLSGVSAARLSDSAMLQNVIEKDLKELEVEIFGKESTYSTEAKVQFLLEKAQIYIMQGLDLKARENVKLAKTVSGFSYAFSGALGKRTKFQQTDISQLVVFAKSKESDGSQDDPAERLSGALEKRVILNGDASGQKSKNVPTALDLNDDTLLSTLR